jgi:hypothetical protein
MLVFPYSKDCPTRLVQQAILFPISLLISLDFGSPKLTVALGPRHVLGTSVPKAAVDEHRDTPAGKDDVGPNGDIVQLEPKVNSVT